MAQMTRADGGKIRRLRETADLTVDELVARLAADEGMSRHPDHIRNVELGYTQPGFKLLNAISRVLNVPREQLLADADAADSQSERSA